MISNLRDAQANVMAINEWRNNDTLKTKEFDIFGSDRLGLMADERILYTAQSGPIPPPTEDEVIRRGEGKKRYELKNHLGNVMAVITDKKIGGIIGTDVYWFPDVKTVQDYYPFGMLQPERQFSSGKYRYGFNAMEKDDEVKGVGNSIDFGGRIYDPRISRFLSVDPLASHFPGWSPYAAFNNNPINLVDPDGRAAVPPGKTYDDETGEMIHDDKIDDKKVYLGTETDGSDRKYIGQESDFQDVTTKFNDQLDRTGKFFSEMNQDFDNKFHSDVVTGIASVDKMLFFKKNVTDGGRFDIKVTGKGYSEGEIGTYSFYSGKLFRYDDYGNYNYGRAASAFGYGEKTALLGAGLNQTGKALFNLEYAKKNWYPISNFSNLGDDSRDSYMIKQGFNHVK